MSPYVSLEVQLTPMTTLPDDSLVNTSALDTGTKVDMFDVTVWAYDVDGDRDEVEEHSFVDEAEAELCFEAMQKKYPSAFTEDLRELL